METVAGVRVDVDEGGTVTLGGARFTVNEGLRLSEALVRASFRAAVSQEVAATHPPSTEKTDRPSP